jgi:DNA-binding transcriptional MerR regulator
MINMTEPGVGNLIDDDVPDDSSESGRNKPRKAPNAFRTISEVADDLHIPQHVLRFWETKFPQVKPLKRGGGRRYYRPDDILLLKRISDLLYIQGYTIKGVQRLLREGGGKLSDEIPPPAPDEQAESEALHEAYDPQLPMPGIAPPLLTPSSGRTLTRPPRGITPVATPASGEVERLYSILLRTLTELETLRALL